MERRPSFGSRYVQITVAARLDRIWQMVETIASEPGLGRHALSVRFILSERQIQADLIAIREALGLPLVRRQGYRFVDEGGIVGTGRTDLTLVDTLTLVFVLAHASQSRALRTEAVEGLARRMPTMLPPHLAPLGVRLTRAVLAGRRTQEDAVILALADAILAGRTVRLERLGSGDESVTVTPRLLVPCYEHWLLLARLDGTKHGDRVYPIDAITGVTAALAKEARRASA